VVLEAAYDLEQQSALPDPGPTDDRGGANAPLVEKNAVAERRQLGELCFAADERHLPRRSTRGSGMRPSHLPDVHRLSLPLRLYRLRFTKLERVFRRQVGLLADQNPVRGRGRLDARRGVEDVASGRPLALARAGPEHYERLTGVDANADVQVEPLVLHIQLREGLADREGCADRALRVVLMRLRRAEERQHGVAAELLERAAVPLQLSADARVVRGDERLHVLRGRAAPSAPSTRRGRRRSP